MTTLAAPGPRTRSRTIAQASPRLLELKAQRLDPVPPRLNPRDVVAVVIYELEVDASAFFAGRRMRELQEARLVIAHLCRRETDASYPEICAAMHLKGHASVIGQVARAARLLDAPDERFVILVERCFEVIRRCQAAEMGRQRRGSE